MCGLQDASVDQASPANQNLEFAFTIVFTANQDRLLASVNLCGPHLIGQPQQLPPLSPCQGL